MDHRPIDGSFKCVSTCLYSPSWSGKELEKRKLKIPVLIGGATTSKTHTAVKIEPEYSGCVIHVNDASKAVPVASNLLNKNKTHFKKEIKDEYETIRERFLNNKNEKRFISLKDARKNKHKIDWKKIKTYKPLKLGINKILIPLSDSGYRKFSNENYEMFCDIGRIGPSYQAGHSHADTFNFELTIKGRPIIVDTGTSTYNIGVERSLERSTKAHNTVTVNDANSSQVWSGFRVAKRAHVSKLEENKNQLTAIHNGYRHKGVLHKRTWETQAKEITITDELLGKEAEGKVYFHLHPNVKLEKNEEGLMLNNHVQIIFKVIKKVNELKTSYSPEFNIYKKNVTLEIIFKKKCTTNIKIK